MTPEKELDAMMPALYEELRRIAGEVFRRFRRTRGNLSLQPSDVVSEAYLRLREQRNLDANQRSHFLAAAAKTMRRVLLDYVRRGDADKRPPRARRVSLDGRDFGKEKAVDLVALNDALEQLGSKSPRAEAVVELRYFGGGTTEEVAEALGVSPRTVAKEWTFAKVWLLRELSA